MKIPTQMKGSIRILAILLLLSYFIPINITPVSAVSIIVNTTNDEEIDDSICSLREAIIAAKNHADYYGCVGGSTAYIALPAGIYTVDDQMTSIGIEITINGADPTTTIIQASSCNPTEESCTNDHHFVWVSGAGTLTLENLTFRNWKNTGDINGGAIYNAGELNIINNVFTQNQATRGAAFLNNGGTVVIVSGSFSGGISSENGGAIYNMNSGSLSIDESTFSDNRATDGGAIYSYSTVEIINSTFSGNLAESDGGAILNNDGDLSITRSTFLSNMAKNEGDYFDAGAIYNSTTGSVTVEESTFSGNNGRFGGAILNLGTMEINNSTFSGNSATIRGGAIYNFESLTITSSTFSENTSEFGGAGIENDDDGTLNYMNTIIANSVTGSDCNNDGGTIGTNVANMVEDGSCEADYSGDPLLGPLAENGGPTMTHALLTGSTAIDNGNLAACPDADQRGVTRPQGAGCDIGAYEKESARSIYLPLIMKE